MCMLNFDSSYAELATNKNVTHKTLRFDYTYNSLFLFIQETQTTNT